MTSATRFETSKSEASFLSILKNTQRELELRSETCKRFVEIRTEHQIYFGLGLPFQIKILPRRRFLADRSALQTVAQPTNVPAAA